MDTLIATETYKNHTIEIHYDDAPLDPRGDDNLGMLWLTHGRYAFPQEIDIDTTETTVYDAINEACDPPVILDVYMMDHSGLAFSFAPFGGYHGHFDSGRVGFTFTTMERIKAYLGFEELNEDRKAQIREILWKELQDFAAYVNGEVHGYKILKDGELVDSCWGFLGNPNNALTAAQDYIDGLDDIA